MSKKDFYPRNIRGYLHSFVSASFIALLLMSYSLTTKVEAAAYATGGAGKYKDLVLWMTWGNTQNNSPGLTGVTISENNGFNISRAAHPLPGGYIMNVSCQITTIRRVADNAMITLQSYRAGNYFYDGFNHLYNIGGTGVSGNGTNALISGLVNTVSGERTRFQVTCTANVSGVPIHIPGLVLADTETLSVGEYIRATAAGTWQVVEVRQNQYLPTAYNISKTDSGRTIEISDGGDGQLSAVAFLKLNTPSSTVTFEIETKGDSRAGLSLGLLVPYADFGDAPASYGDAYHLIRDFDLKDDGIPNDGSKIDFNNNGRDLNLLGLKSATTNFLGTTGPDAEALSYYSPTANGDNAAGFAGLAEEDGWTLPTISLLQANNTLTQTIACTGTGYVVGWIDFDINGTFQLSERSTNMPMCNGVSATLNWNIPSITAFKTGTSYVRLRMSTNLANLSSPTGLASDGEVEDHVINLVSPIFAISKVSNATVAGWYKGQSNTAFTLSVKNNGLVGNNDSSITINPANAAFRTITVIDDLPTGIVPSWTGTLTSGLFSCTFAAQRVTCQTTSNIAPGVTGNITLPVTVNTDTNSTLTNYASVGGGFDPYNNGVTPAPNNCTPTTNTHCGSTTVSITNPHVSVTKTANPASGTRVFLNDEIVYTLAVTVTGRALLSNAVLTDILPAGLEYIAVTSNTGGFTDTFSTDGRFTLNANPIKNPGTYSISFRAKVLESAKSATNLINTVSVSGGSTATPTCTNCTTTHPVSISQLKITKTAVPITSMISDVGDQLKFSFLVENTGDTTINTIAVTDNFLTAAGISVSSVETLAPGANSIVEAVYTLKTSDFLATKVDNTAYAAGTDNYSRAVRSNDSSTSTPLIQRPELSIVKTAGVPSGNGVGSTITYTFLVTNTGNLDLTNVAVKDPFLTAANVTIPTIGALAVNGSQTVSATYSLKGTDFLNGQVDNSATAEGRDPNNNPVASTPSTVTTLLTQNPNITLVTTASAASGNNVGDTITYTFTVENTGNLPLTNVIIDDILLAVANVTIPAVGNLAVGEIKAVNATYVLTKANFIAGMVDNTATAEGDTPTAQTITSQPSNTSTPLVQTPALSLVKTAAPATGSNLGDTIPYSFLVENTGDLPLTNVVINDPLLAAAGVTIPTIPTLAVGASQTVTANYSLTAANFLSGHVDNVATAAARDPNNNPIVSNPSSTVTPLNKLADLKLVKTAGAPTGARIGDTVNFTFAVTNEGNQPLNTVLINDPLLIAAGITVPPVGELAVGETKTVTANYILTGDDFILGEVATSAVAFAKGPDGTSYTSVASDTLTLLQQLSSVSLIKSATAATGNRAGETITFRFVVENTGNLPLTNVVIDDPLLAAAGVTVPAIATLAVGETQIVSAIYTLTDTDFVNSSVDNIATARGTDSKNTPVVSNPSDTTTPLQQIATLELVKTAGAPSGNKAGSTVTYNFAVTNTGNIPLTNVVINDDLLTAAGVTVAPISNLGVGATITVSAVYVLTPADFQLGKVINITQAQGQDLNNSPILSNSSTTETPLAQLGEIQLLKTAGAPRAQQAGATLDYTFRIENTGNVNLTNVIVRDPMLSAAGVVLTQIPLVTVGEVVTLTIPYTLTQADIDNGRVDNVATVVSRDPTERLVESDPSSTSTPLTGENRLTLQKTAGEVQGNTAGATILYTFVVTNSGATTLRNVVIDDALLTNARVTLEPIGTLLPGDSKTVTATYIVTQADFDRGIVENIAQARGNDPKGSPYALIPMKHAHSSNNSPSYLLKNARMRQ
jgi:uncharacterized repeat protein (TIGR01451 family)